MRRVGLLVACGLVGCVKLNAAYGDGKDAGTGGDSATGTTRGADTTGGPTTEDSASAESPDVTSGGAVTTSGPDDTGVDPHTVGPGDSGGETSGEGSSETGTSDWPVMFIWATPFGLPLGTQPSTHCMSDPPNKATLMCDESPRAVTGTAASAFEDVVLSFGGNPEVYGLLGGGKTRIAASPAAMLAGLETDLVAAGTGLSEGQIFWTGANNTCEDWTSEMAQGTHGSAASVEASWYETGESSCGEGLPVLCACRAMTNPFR